MKIVIPGGSGQVGQVLARAFHRDGHEVVVLSRDPQKQPWQTLHWDGRTISAWAAELDGAEVVINLAGRSVNCRYHPKNRCLIMDSRIDSVRVIGEAIAKTVRPPKVWLQASTATIYSHRYDAPNDDRTGLIGGNEPNLPDTWKFSIDVATSWERALDEAATPGTRKVKLRSAITFSPDAGGVFEVLLNLVRRGLGGMNGDGKQFVSWIHHADFVRSIYWILEHPELDDAINLAAPQPLPNKEFMASLREAWGARIGLPATKWMLEIGTFLLRTETELVLKSRRVVPTRLLESGFQFKFGAWPEAAKDLCCAWRELNQR